MTPQTQPVRRNVQPPTKSVGTTQQTQPARQASQMQQRQVQSVQHMPQQNAHGTADTPHQAHGSYYGTKSTQYRASSQPAQPQRPAQHNMPKTSQQQVQSQQYRTSPQTPQNMLYSRPHTSAQERPHQAQSRDGHTTRTYSRSQMKNNPPTHTPSGQKLTASQRHKIAQGKTVEQAVSREKDNTFASVIKAMLYIVFIIVTSGFLSYYIIAIGNDVFAFVKSDDVVVVSLEEGATTDDVAQLLYEKDVIKFPTVFKLYIGFRGSLSSLVEGGFMTGVFEVSPAMGYDDLVFSLVPKGVSREEVSVTIREGLTVNEIINIFVEKGIGTREGFIDVIQNYDFDYWFIDELNTLNPDRTYRLEG